MCRERRERREVTGIPLWLLREYLEESGGRTPAGDRARDRVEGEGWSVCLEQLEDFVVGSLRVGRVGLEIEGSEEGYRRLMLMLEPKLLRAGG